MPNPVLHAYAEMRPRIEADRFLELINAVAGGTGHLVPGAVDKLLRVAQARAAGAPDQGSRKLRTAAEWQAVGMRINRIEKKAD